MTDARFAFPKPEVRGSGHVLYRCAACRELMEPDAAVIVADKSYHPAHAPEAPLNGR